jgi:hypothetical protein
MSHRIFSLLGCLLLSLFASAQITVESSDFPSAGDMVLLDFADTLLLIDPEPTGENFTWNFSALSSVSQVTQEYVSPVTTDFTYILLWPASNVAAPFVAPIDLGTVPIEDGVEFFNNNSSRFQQTGLAGSVSGIPVPFSFDPPDRIAEFPMNYGDSHSSPSAFSLEVPGLVGVWEERMRSCEVDGWGTLQLSGGSHQVLRQRCEILIEDSITGSLGSFNISRITREYRWWGKNAVAPILQIDEQELAGFSSISRIAFQGGVTSTNDIAEEILAGIQSTVQDQQLIISHQLPALRLNIYTAAGQLLYSEQNLSQQTSINLSGFARGTLLLEFQTEDGWAARPIQH